MCDGAPMEAWPDGLGRHFEKKVECQKKEDEVGGPCRQERRELADAAHRFRQSRESPVGDADAHAKSDSADSATTAHEKSEGNREHHADGGDERVGNFLVPLDGQRGDIEASVAKAVDVAAEVAPT